MRFSRIISTLLLLAALGCSDEESTPPPAGIVQTPLAGSIYLQSPLAGARVAVFDCARGIAGESLVSTRTDDQGRFGVDLGPIGGDLCIRAEADSSTKLEATVLDVPDGEGRTGIVISPVTTLAVALARSPSFSARPWPQRIQEATGLIESHFGGLDHGRIVPGSLETPVTERTTVALLLAGFSAQAEAIRIRAQAGPGVVDAARLVAAYVSDIEADGVFDGLGASGLELVGGLTLDGESLRGDFALALRAVLAQTEDLDEAGFRTLIADIASRQSSIFPVSGGMDEVGPQIIEAGFVADDGAVLAPGSAVSGQARFRIEASDPAGVSFIRLRLADVVLGETAGVSAEYPVDTSAMADGSVTLQIEAEDAFGNIEVQDHEAQIDNTAPEVVLSFDAFVGSPSVQLGVSVTESGSGVVSSDLTIDGGAPRPVDLSDGVALMPVQVQCPGESEFRVTARDAAGNEGSRLGRIQCDDRAPTIRLLETPWQQEGAYAVTYAGDGAALTYDSTGASVETFRNLVAAPVRIEKYFNKLDDLPSMNVPELRFVVEDESSGPVRVEYRYLVGSSEVRPWEELVERPGEPYRVTVSYQDLSPELVLSPPGVVHAIELRATNALDHVTSRTVPFEMEVLVPPVWVGGCGASPGGPSAANLRPMYTEAGLRTPVLDARIVQVLDLPATTLAPAELVELAIQNPQVETAVTEGYDVKFQGPNQSFTGVPPATAGCNWITSFGGTWSLSCRTSWHQIAPRTNPSQTITRSGLAPSGNVLWPGRVAENDPEQHTTSVRYQVAGSEPNQSASGRPLLPREAAMSVTVELVEPRIYFGGVLWDLPASPPGLPTGMVAANGAPSAPVWLPSIYGYIGRQGTGLTCSYPTTSALGPPPSSYSCQWSERLVESYGYLSLLEVTVAPLPVEAWFGPNALPVPVVYGGSCAETVELGVYR